MFWISEKDLSVKISLINVRVYCSMAGRTRTSPGHHRSFELFSRNFPYVVRLCFWNRTRFSHLNLPLALPVKLITICSHSLRDYRRRRTTLSGVITMNRTAYHGGRLCDLCVQPLSASFHDGKRWSRYRSGNEEVLCFSSNLKPHRWYSSDRSVDCWIFNVCAGENTAGRVIVGSIGFHFKTTEPTSSKRYVVLNEPFADSVNHRNVVRQKRPASLHATTVIF